MKESNPSKGRVNWRCFHCDETFRSRDAAREHFGPTECSKPACAIDVAEYRRMEAELARWRSEDTDLHRALYAEQAKLMPAVRRAEEQGYERGLADGRKLPDETPDEHAELSKSDIFNAGARLALRLRKADEAATRLLDTLLQRYGTPAFFEMEHETEGKISQIDNLIAGLFTPATGGQHGA